MVISALHLKLSASAKEIATAAYLLLLSGQSTSGNLLEPTYAPCLPLRVAVARGLQLVPGSSPPDSAVRPLA